jgi:hypothetical protein
MLQFVYKIEKQNAYLSLDTTLCQRGQFNIYITSQVLRFPDIAGINGQFIYCPLIKKTPNPYNETLD